MEHQTHIAKQYDVVIVGARCAGAATAMLLARQGARVLLVDWSSPASETVSTHALMRGAVLQLDRWGVLDRIRASQTPAIRTTTFHYGPSRVALPIKPSPGVDALYAPRRSVLDSALVASAWDAGVTVRYGVAFRDVVTNKKGRVTGAVLHIGKRKVTVSTRIVIGADGRRSTVARRVHAKTEKMARNTTACVYGYFDGVPDTGTHWHFAPGLGTGFIPTNDGLHCVFAAMPQERFADHGRQARSGADLAAFVADANPEGGALLQNATLRGRLTGFYGQKGFTRRSWGRGWALVGDAGYFKDPLTAHGITDALRDAEILAAAISRDTTQALARYQHTRDALSADLFDVTDQIAGLNWDMAQLQDMHMRLNTAMKQEQTWMAENFQPLPIAA